MTFTADVLLQYKILKYVCVCACVRVFIFLHNPIRTVMALFSRLSVYVKFVTEKLVFIVVEVIFTRAFALIIVKPTKVQFIEYIESVSVSDSQQSL